MSSHLYKGQCHLEQQPGAWGGLPGAMLWEGADLFLQGSLLKSECLCWGKGGVG